MKRRCERSGVIFEISSEDQEFYKQMGLPLPKLCPQERNRRRMSYRNFRSLYHRKCDGTGSPIISMYHSDVPFPVYDQEYWWSDNWDASEFQQPVDFSRPFFEQYRELAMQVPRFNVMNVKSENCSYSNMVHGAQNCYLVFGCVRDEDCMYGHIVWDSSNCLDMVYGYRCEWCSNSVDIVDCYDVHFSQETSNSSECFFMLDCANCQNCFGCVGIRKAQYCFLNKQLSKAEYQERMEALLPLQRASIDKMEKWLEAERTKQLIAPEYYGLKNEEVSGNHIYESKGLECCFDSKQCEDSKYLFTAHGEEHCYDISFTGSLARFCNECLTIANGENLISCHMALESHDCSYSEFCFSSHDLFGCNGLRNAQYCIFNKQYSKEEYFKIRDKLIEHMEKTGEWGEFFPIHDSPFAYNESIAFEYMPLTKEEVLKRGWKWRDDPQEKKGQAVLQTAPEFLPDSTDQLCQTLFKCKDCSKPYRIAKQECRFIEKLRIPIPGICPDCRHGMRMGKRAKRELHSGNCQECDKPIQSAHLGGWTSKVYCNDCYLTHLYDEDVSLAGNS